MSKFAPFAVNIMIINFSYSWWRKEMEALSALLVTSGFLSQRTCSWFCRGHVYSSSGKCCYCILPEVYWISCHHAPFNNTLKPSQNYHHFADNILKCILLDESVWIPFRISLKFVPMFGIDNIPALVQKMDCCQPGHKPLSEPMMVSLLTHTCVTQPQCVQHVWIIFHKPGSGHLSA